MHQLTRPIFVAITASLSLINAGAIASATPIPTEATGVIEMPLAGNWRSCDGTLLKWVAVPEYARAFAQVSTPAANTVAANVTLVTGEPNMHYNVRVVQVPRTSLGCAAGDPGVIAGGFETDAAGAGAVNLQGPIHSGTTGAWVIVDRPAAHSQAPAEFYTTTFVAAI